MALIPKDIHEAIRLASKYAVFALCINKATAVVVFAEARQILEFASNTNDPIALDALWKLRDPEVGSMVLGILRGITGGKDRWREEWDRVRPFVLTLAGAVAEGVDLYKLKEGKA